MAKTEFTGAQLDEIAGELKTLPVKDTKRRRYDRDGAVQYLQAVIMKLLDDGYSPKDVVTLLHERGIRTSVAKIRDLGTGSPGTAPVPIQSPETPKKVQGKLDV